MKKKNKRKKCGELFLLLSCINFSFWEIKFHFKRNLSSKQNFRTCQFNFLYCLLFLIYLSIFTYISMFIYLSVCMYLFMHALVWTPTHGHTNVGQSAKTYIHQFCVDSRSHLEDLPSAMANRNGWWERERERERVKGIHAVSTLWWWWWSSSSSSNLFSWFWCYLPTNQIHFYFFS